MRRFILLILPVLIIGCVQEKEVKEIRVSYQPGWHHVALFVIMEKGWDEIILGKRLIATSFPSGPPQMEAFSAKQHEIAYVGVAPPLSILSRGFDAKIVAVVNTEGSSLISTPDFEFKGIESIGGKRVMTYPPGSIQWTILTTWLKEKGIRTELISASGAAEIREALRSRAIDLAFVPDPFPYVSLNEGYGKIIMNSSQMAPMHPCCIVLMRGDFMKNRELAVKFVALHIIASEFVMDERNKEEVMRILVKWLKIDEKIAKEFPGTTKFHTDPRDGDWLNGVENLCKAQFELGVTRDVDGKIVKLNPDSIVDTTLYTEALKMVPKIKEKIGIQ
ncbi:MAG: ABC transporter substrate-binding protein [Archaeoglobaceae archaeon]|nr:ABC transporter substrate-binding protein [Archaeoglobaceae archaeon]MDW7990271.1 ABC transporter substrate-binding protein [Archaeoglobaceae archaeon]